jgi:CubicO group peptidase (beta-lactamase class C family)
LSTGARWFCIVVAAALSGCSPRGLAIDAVIGTAGTLAIEEGVAGMVIGVEQHGVRRVRAFGRARIGPDVPSRTDEPFEIGSISKQFTAALVLQLVDEGKLRLDETVGGLLPDAPPAARDVTVAQLLSHTGGVTNYLDLDTPEAVRRYAAAGSAMDLLAMVRDLPLRFAPGRRWEYSNSGYLLLGDIVARRGGAPWEALVASRLTRPLGLSATRSCTPPDDDPRRPLAYDHGGRVQPSFGRYFPEADGSLCSTADDLLTWARELDRGHILSAASHARMTTPALLDGGRSAEYGFAQRIVSRDDHRVLFHTGRVHRFASVLERWPDDDLTVVVFQNTPSNMADYTAMNVGAVLVQGPDALFVLRCGWAHRWLLAGLFVAAALALVWRRRR